MKYKECADMQASFWKSQYGNDDGIKIMQLCPTCQRKYYNEGTTNECCSYKLKL